METAKLCQEFEDYQLKEKLCEKGKNICLSHAFSQAWTPISIHTPHHMYQLLEFAKARHDAWYGLATGRTQHFVPFLSQLHIEHKGQGRVYSLETGMYNYSGESNLLSQDF